MINLCLVNLVEIRPIILAIPITSSHQKRCVYLIMRVLISIDHSMEYAVYNHLSQ